MLLEEQRPHLSSCRPLGLWQRNTPWVSRKADSKPPFTHPPSSAFLTSVPYEYLHLHLQVYARCRLQVQQAAPSLLPSFPFLALVVCPQPNQTKSELPTPSTFVRRSAACTCTRTRTRAPFLPLGLPIHSRIHSHSLSPLPPFASPNLSYTPRSPPCHPPTDPVFNPQILSSIPRNPPKSKQFLSQTTARSTKKIKNLPVKH